MSIPLVSDPLAAIEQLRHRTDPHGRYNYAVALRLANRLDDCGEVGATLWQKGYRTPWLALLMSNLRLDYGYYQSSLEWATAAWELFQLQADDGSRGPDYALPLACARLRLGIWNEHTWRLWELGRLGRSWDPAPHTKPWKGEPEKLVVLSEGGYGDVFCFTRFFRMLDPIQRAASRFVIGPGLGEVKSLRDEWDGVKTIFADEVFDWSSFRYSTALMSLPAGLKIRGAEEIPAADPSWRPSVQYERLLWGGRLRPWPRFGICWKAQELGVQKRSRSIDNELELKALEQFEFVSLVPHEGIVIPVKIVDAGIRTWMETAQLISTLDCVVSVDTACLHLAGLLGVPAIGILPLSSDWKYLTEREDCIWWKSVRPIRNTSPYTWKPALEQAAALLEKM